MIAPDRWERNLRVVAPGDAVRVDIPRSLHLRQIMQRRAFELPSGTAVVLRDAAPGSRWRCRRFARRAGIELERTYLALPSLSAPAYLVQDAPASVRYFCSAILTVPPGLAVFAGVVEGLLRLVQVVAPWRIVGIFVPGRVAVGRRT